MDKHSEYLQKEANYQDSKITKDVRKGIGKAYNDEASRYRYVHRDKEIGEVKDKRILDIGCGNGFESMKALRNGAYVTAIDISPKSIEQLVSMAKEENLDQHLQAAVMDAHKLALADNSFDIVLGNGILHHLPQLEIALNEINRVLKPGGHAVFQEPMGMNPLINLFRLLTPKLRTRDEQPFRTRELKLFQQVFHEAEFVFFDLTTMIAKIPLFLGMKKFANGFQKKLIRLDDRILRSKKKKKISFWQKMSWTTLIVLRKL